MTPGRAALVVLMHRYLGGLLDPFVTLLEVHKLMYFMQEAGQPLRLQYAKAPYGPYAENLRHVLHAVEGHLVSGYADGGDAPNKQIELVPGAIVDANDISKMMIKMPSLGSGAWRSLWKDPDTIRLGIAFHSPLGCNPRTRRIGR